MPPEKKNNIMNIVLGSLFSLLITAFTWAGSQFMDMRDNLKLIMAEKAGDHKTVTEDHETVSGFRLKMGMMDDKNDDHNRRLIILEAILPEAFKRKK